MPISITKEDIDKGTDTHSFNPLALAVKRSTGAFTVITATLKEHKETTWQHIVWIEQERNGAVKRYVIPQEIFDWMEAFYHKKNPLPPKPFEVKEEDDSEVLI